VPMKRLMRLLVPGLILLALVFCGLSVASTRAEETAILSGRVTAEGSGAGIDGVLVFEATTGLWRQDNTSGGGYYSIDISGYSSVHLVASHASYATAHDYAAPVPGTRDFVLTTDKGTINVEVRDLEDHSLIAGFDVLLMADSVYGTGFASGSTDDGTGTLTNLAPMTYFVHAFPQDGPGGYFDGRVANITIDGDGDVENVTIYLTDEGGIMNGRVVDEYGGAVSGALVYLNGSAEGGGASTCSTATNGSGYFNCPLAGGNYDVHVSNVQTSYPVFQLFKGGVTLTGQVTNLAGEPLESVTIDPFPWFDPGTWGRQYTNSEGMFSFTLLVAGTYQIFAHASGYEDTDIVTDLYNGSNVVNFVLYSETELLVVSPDSLFVLGDHDGSVLSKSFDTLNGGASGTFTWTASSVSAPGNLVTVTTASGSEGDPVMVDIDPGGLVVGATYTGTLTVAGSGSAGTREVPIEVLVVEDIHNAFLPIAMK